jgi:ABC-2 type transport system permease protein
MGAIYKRELSSYFNSAIAYVVMALFYGFSAYFFVVICFMQNTANLAYTFSNMFTILIFLTPILTMKSFSEEKRQRTDQALLTSPASLFEIVMGKFLGAATLYGICCLIFLVYGLVITVFTMPDWPALLCTFLGFYLLGCALISINIFISALTESQVIAAIGSMAVGLFIYLSDSFASMIKVEWIVSIINSLSFTNYFSNFLYGILDVTGIVYFLSIIVLFNFFTIRVFEKRRWG